MNKIANIITALLVSLAIACPLIGLYATRNHRESYARVADMKMVYETGEVWYELIAADGSVWGVDDIELYPNEKVVLVFDTMGTDDTADDKIIKVVRG